MDDAALAVTAISRVLIDRGMLPVEIDHYRSIFGFPICSYYEKLGLDTDPESMKVLSDEFHRNYDDGFDTCGLHSGALELLVEVKSLNLTQSILSAAQQDWLIKQLKLFQIDGHFDHVFGLSDFLAHSKLERGRQLIAASGIEPSAALLIGDTDHDVEVAQALGIDVIIYADGHQAPAAFKRFNVPVFTRSETY